MSQSSFQPFKNTYKSKRGVVSCGHASTANAAARMLQEGGNAYDAVFAAHFAACVAEPVLAGLAGGGFLLSRPTKGTPVLYDFFTHTPRAKRPLNEIEFYPIEANFGDATQEFHIGAGSVATPGVVKGMFSLYQDQCSLPLNVLFEPAIELAKTGVMVNDFQAYLFTIIQPILSAHPATYDVFKSPTHSDNEKHTLIQANETLLQPSFADTLEALGREQDALFYKGEIANSIDRYCRENGGHLRLNDLQHYQAIKRNPLQCNYLGHQLYFNPPPSTGGILIAFALKLLELDGMSKYQFKSPEYVEKLSAVMHLTNVFRKEKNIDKVFARKNDITLDEELIHHYSSLLPANPPFNRGTTHISVLDEPGNVASLTVSNGEGCGFMFKEYGFMLNNMLGEEDLNPGGFHQWPENVRMSSMMCPTLLETNWSNGNNKTVVLGSGGSNRIRSAILQVIIQLLDYRQTLEQAVENPRLHFENNELNLEPGFGEADLRNIGRDQSNIRQWTSKNLFFGGVHTVASDTDTPEKLEGVGDSRRGGKSIIVN